MERLQKEIRGNLLTYGCLREIIKKKGVLSLMDFAISGIIHTASKRMYKPLCTDYGLSEALFCSRTINQFERYARVVNEIRKMKAKAISVLEIGAGGEGISFFSNLFEKRCNFFLVDVSKDVFNDLKKKQAIIGDGCRLPFKDKAFDVIVSVDAIEHVTKSNRHNFCEELKRVCKKRLIITCPLQSADDVFQGEKYDMVFQYSYEREHGLKEPNTAQHIASSHPTLCEINLEFPNSAIYGYRNCDVWLKYMLFSSKPLIGLFSGVLYYLFWKKGADEPPYWGAIITLDFKNHLIELPPKIENRVCAALFESPKDSALNIGESTVKLVRTKDVFSVTAEEMKKNPRLLYSTENDSLEKV